MLMKACSWPKNCASCYIWMRSALARDLTLKWRVFVLFGCLWSHRRSWTAVQVYGNTCVWKGTPSFWPDSCGLGWNSWRSQCSLKRMSRYWDRATVIPTSSSTDSIRSVYESCSEVWSPHILLLRLQGRLSHVSWSVLPMQSRSLQRWKMPF